MNAETYATLLKDLQKLEKRIAEAHVAAVRASPAEQARLNARHQEAEVGGRLDDYVSMQARKSAVQFLLRTVYVRVLEDLGALSPLRVRGQWGEEAFRALAPALGKRDYFAFIFEDLSRDLPALFTPGPDELGLPPEDLCRETWALWHREDGRGNLSYDWRPAEQGGNNGGFDSRFLGDLYQDLDAEVRKRYALLQTPVFVERYILDRTLTPALAEFDPAELRRKGERFRLLDPTCGSGHFLVGAFHRLADHWEAQGLSAWEAAERALESVWGCDINPHAVDIARFRLLLEVRARTGVGSLARLSGLTLNLAVMDSLIPWERGSQDLFPANDRLSRYGSASERRANAAFLGRAFHVVVGNPPYITPKDVRKRDDYRQFWPDSCHRTYALAAPFLERFFVLGAKGAFVGQITANSFMKREFGKKLVETVLPRWDLTGVVDTSGAYIPGHGTPTVILFGRARRPVGDAVWAVLGKRGEPKRPEDAEKGLVWTSIRLATGDDDTSPFITSAIVPRPQFSRHPWSLGGGAASEIKQSLESSGVTVIAERVADTGRTVHTGEDEAFFADAAWLKRCGMTSYVALVLGEDVRDFSLNPNMYGFFPYDAGATTAQMPSGPGIQQHLQRVRAILRERQDYGQKIEERGLSWYEWSMFFPRRYLEPRSIGFSFVATHNHFVLDRGGKVFNRSAPVIKLPASATLDDHLDLLGLLNSSALGFWMRQVFYPKGGDKKGDGSRVSTEIWSDRLEYDSTKLQRAPLTDRDRPARVALAAALDEAARQRAACMPAAVLAADFAPAELPRLLAEARARYRSLTHRMVALQEELDWLTYGSYTLLDPPTPTVGPDEVEPLLPGHRPFEILFARADDEADPDEKSAWWSRHGHDRVTEIPAGYSAASRARIQARMDLIEADPRLQLLEAPAFKRRWQTPDLDKATTEAAEGWLLDRLEDLFAPPSEQSRHQAAGALSEPRPYTLESVVAAWQRDPHVQAVAGVWAGTGASTDLSLVAEKLLKRHALPDNPMRVYTAEGLRKLEQWKATWALQDREDAGEKVEIPLPPKFDKADFQADYFATRGKLNVPRERFIVFSELRPARYGWNGWRDLQRALAQLEAFTLTESDPEDPLPVPSSDDPRRCGATLGLWESLPDVRRWAGAEHHAELHDFAQQSCQQPRCPCPVLERWQLWRAGKLPLGAAAAAGPGPVSVEERALALRLFEHRQAALAGPAPELGPRTLDQLQAAWTGPAERLAAVLDDLVATGDLQAMGRGKKRRFQKSGSASPRSA